MAFEIKLKENFLWDLASLGEVMLRFDPGEERIHNARNFRVWEGGGEYNVARGLSKVFKKNTTIITALVKNSLGDLAEDLIMQGGVDVSNIHWKENSVDTRNGLYFIERGFGLMSPKSCFDRDNTAVSQLQPSDFDWQKIFKEKGVRWLHTGGIFTGLSDSTPEVAKSAMKAAQKNGTIVSYDLNYRDSLWKDRGGRDEANKLNKELLPFADIVFGVPDYASSIVDFDADGFRNAAQKLQDKFPNLKYIATTFREARSASKHNLTAACFADGEVFKALRFLDVQVFDRVGSGDSFASGFIYGMLEEKGTQYAVECGTAHSCLAMTTPGDNSMARLEEIEKLMSGGDLHVVR
ncbi:MAG: sugar kinase [Pyrinomonadaceae bacterium]|nr:sugar kinase [Pyrinomonadaceae bacterium]